MTCREPEWCLTATWTFIPIALIIAAIVAVLIWQSVHQPDYTCDLRIEFPNLTMYLVGFLQGALIALAVEFLIRRCDHDPDQGRKERGQSGV